MYSVKKTWKLTGIVLALLMLIVCVSLPATKPIIEQAKVKVIIDAGHGIPDGGAVGLDGTHEQILNLGIARKLYAKFSAGSAVMTREDENGIYIVDGSIREKKISDMKERIKIAEQYPKALYLSIHMNTYSGESVHGCQVFYRAEDEKAKQIAQTLQSAVNESLQPESPKTVKPISDSLYLFSHTGNTAVLIECGFMTNPTDLQNLKDEAYQEKIAELIYQSVTEV